ncbi:hypothetical protein C7444_101265 [Sphaerotilus hippei]|uniref:Peptidase S53 domain-containing protein n=1 Tax=Sphaerotilus hippei TaxID=744406 RepID=A0A318H6D1_9BURK|nr:S53 family peptidase [Sphaerotilus hippei]PXW99435.1 hypothetical protein C7444_101265 [Sphaerotilus hippei]
MPASSVRSTLTLTAAAVALLLAGCGGGGEDSAAAEDTSTIAAAEADGVEALPVFHMAPVLPDEPSDIDADGSSQSAGTAPQTLQVPATQAALSTARLLPDQLRARAAAASDQAGTLATSTTATVYTPAQIRAAYGYPTLAATGTTLSADQAASFGSAQTIYIVNAYHHPNVAKDLAVFNQKFGLPTCTTTTLSASTRLPLATPASGSGCALTIAYASTKAGLASSAPKYNAGWASEIALDVQWAHAVAPMARIVLIEAVDASVNSLLSAIQLAAKMGPGVVSMSFGASEGTWTSQVDGVFKASGLSYVAASGDNGTQMNWPAVSGSVLSVGGTTLSYASGSARSETTWSGSGGGTSAYVAMPSYQGAVSVPGKNGSSPKRAGPDVASNADPYSGHYVYLTASGATTGTWYVFGGTSAGAPQWAAGLAIANARRARAGKAVLGQPHPALYQGIAAVSATYAAALLDITTGSNGSCTTCSAVTGYDLATGLGSPNAGSLLTALQAY